METRIIYFLCWFITYGITFEDLRHFCIQYWAKTEFMIFILIIAFIILVEILAYFSNTMLHIISLKQRRLLQFWMHLALVANSIVLSVLHHKNWTTIILTILISIIYFLIIHPWIHKMQEDKHKEKAV